MWYRREGGLIVGGPYNCEQAFPTECLDESHPDVQAMHTRARTITPTPTLQDVIDVLTAGQKAQLAANLNAKVSDGR